jgi:hypothetical protein
MYFKMTDESKTETCSQLAPAIEKCKNVTVKGEYLGFHDVDAVTKLAVNFFLERFNDRDKFFVLQMLNDVQLVKNIVQDPRISDERMKEHFVEWLKKSPVFEQQSNLLDVLMRYYPSDREVKDIYMRMRFGKKGKGNLYEDEQNVHDVDIQQGVHQAVGRLLEWDEKAGPLQPPPNTPFKAFATNLLQQFTRTQREKDCARLVVERMCIDHTSFPTTVGNLSRPYCISDVFLALMNYISRSKSREDMVGPLNEEIEAMSELCSSGYPTHLMNVLRGFDERFHFNISFEKQLYAVVSHSIQTRLDKAPENVVLGSFEEEHRAEYVRFVRDIVNELIETWNQDYGEQDVKVHLASTLQSVTGLEGWRLSNNNRVYYHFDSEGEASESSAPLSTEGDEDDEKEEDNDDYETLE